MKYLLACLLALIFAASAYAQTAADCTRWIGTDVSASASDLSSGAGMSPGDCISDYHGTDAPNNTYLRFQSDGNLVLYNRTNPTQYDNSATNGGDTALWASGTNGTGANYVVMWASGNLTIYSSGWTQRWTAYLWSGWQYPVANSTLRVNRTFITGVGRLWVREPDGTPNWGDGY